jgi:hypothetical protein
VVLTTEALEPHASIAIFMITKTKAICQLWILLLMDMIPPIWKKQIWLEMFYATL